MPISSKGFAQLQLARSELSSCTSSPSKVLTPDILLRMVGGVATSMETCKKMREARSYRAHL